MCAEKIGSKQERLVGFSEGNPAPTCEINKWKLSLKKAIKNVPPVLMLFVSQLGIHEFWNLEISNITLYLFPFFSTPQN